MIMKMGKDKATAKLKDTTRREVAVRHVVNDIMMGATKSVIIQKLMEDEYGLSYNFSSSAASDILRLSRLRIKEDTQEMLPSLRDDMINRNLDVYSECRELGDRLGALKALDQISKICGIYENKVTLAAEVKVIEIDFGLDGEGNEERGGNEVEVQD